MGEAKLKEVYRQKRIEFYWGLPLRTIKSVSAIFLLLPVLMGMVVITCFRDDKWIWEDLD